MTFIPPSALPSAGGTAAGPMSFAQAMQYANALPFSRVPAPTPGMSVVPYTPQLPIGQSVVPYVQQALPSGGPFVPGQAYPMPGGAPNPGAWAWGAPTTPIGTSPVPVPGAPTTSAPLPTYGPPAPYGPPSPPPVYGPPAPYGPPRPLPVHGPPAPIPEGPVYGPPAPTPTGIASSMPKTFFTNPFAEGGAYGAGLKGAWRFGGRAMAGVGTGLFASSYIDKLAEGDPAWEQALQGGAVGAGIGFTLAPFTAGISVPVATAIGGGIGAVVGFFNRPKHQDVDKDGTEAFDAILAALPAEYKPYYRLRLKAELAGVDKDAEKKAIYTSIMQEALGTVQQNVQSQYQQNWATDFSARVSDRMPELYAASNARQDAANAQYLNMARSLVSQLPENQQNYMNQAILYQAQASELQRQAVEQQRLQLPYQLAAQVIQDPNMAGAYGYNPMGYTSQAESTLAPLVDQLAAFGG